MRSDDQRAERTPPSREPRTGVALMALFGVWATALGAGFAAVVVVAAADLGPARLALFVVAGTVLLAGGLRTLYEVMRRLRRTG